MLKAISVLFVAWKGSNFNPLCDPPVELFEITEIGNARKVQTQANYSIGYTTHGSCVLLPPPPSPPCQDTHSFPPPPDFTE